MAVQGQESYKKVFRYISLMNSVVSEMISDIRDGQKTIDELGKPFTNETRRRVPQCPRILIQHMDMAKKVIDIIKQNKSIPEEDRALINFLPPMIQSGGIYQLDCKCTSDDNWFKDDVIIVRLGVEYGEYSFFLIRTVVITPITNRYLEENYKFLHEIKYFIFEILRDGVELSHVYRSTCDFVRKNRPELIHHLTKSFGTAARKQNVEVCNISADSIGIAQENMLFNITVGFQDLFDDTLIYRPPNRYALWIGDTVKVEKGNKAKCVSSYGKKPYCLIYKTPRLL